MCQAGSRTSERCACPLNDSQVEAYPNMVEPYVEALRYLTPLGFDVLTFAIIDRLAGSGALFVGGNPQHDHVGLPMNGFNGRC